MNIFKSIFKARDRPKNYVGGGWSFLFGKTTSGQSVNERTAMQTSAVYACVRVLAESIASLPLHVYERTDDDGKKVKPSHPIYTLLHEEPNPEMTSFVFRETLMTHLLLWGNAYAQIIRNGRGYPIALYPLLPDKMQVDRTESGRIIYTYWGEERQVTLSKIDVLHIPGLGFDGLIGYSPIAMSKNSVGLALATEDYGATFFANGARPSGVLEHPGVVKNPEQLRASWQSQFSGANAHKVAVLEEGLKYHPTSIPPEQAQFLETRKFQIAEIARIFRVPLHMIGDLEKSSFSNITQQSLEYVKYTLTPWIVRWEQSMQQALLLPGEKDRMMIRFNVDGLLRGDYESRMKGYSIGIQNGFVSVNDIRKLEDMNLLSDEDGGNLHFVNGNMVKLRDVGAAYMRFREKTRRENEENNETESEDL